MEITYKRKHNESFMIIESKKEDSVHEIKMIENNKIERLLEMKQMNVDGVRKTYYNISQKESLYDYFETEELTGELFEKVVMYIHLGLEELNRYLIDTNHVLLSPETVFLKNEKDGMKVYLCYYSEVESTIQVQFRSIIEYFLKIVGNEDKEFVALLYELYEICQKEDYTLMELIEHIHSKEYEYTEPYVEKIILEEDLEDTFATEVQEKDFERVSDYFDEEESMFSQFMKKIFGGLMEKKNKVSTSDRYMEDFIIEPDMEISEPTVLLTAENEQCIGKLVYEGNKVEDNFIINQETFRIGSNGGNNHGIIHAKEVSRHHAKIIHTEDGYFIEDLNSTNGTLLNGKSLTYRKPEKLKPMDTVCFANVPYVFI